MFPVRTTNSTPLGIVLVVLTAEVRKRSINLPCFLTIVLLVAWIMAWITTARAMFRWKTLNVEYFHPVTHWKMLLRPPNNHRNGKLARHKLPSRSARSCHTWYGFVYLTDQLERTRVPPDPEELTRGLDKTHHTTQQRWSHSEPNMREQRSFRDVWE